MIGSLYSGASGVKTHSDAMTVTGSNIANVNTIGYKYNRINFEDMLSTSMDSRTEISKGVQIGNVQNIHTQGSFEITESETDVAIDGNGFFTVRGKDGRIYYTRAGQFTYDREGNLITQDGKRVQVRDVDPDTNESIGGLKDINVLNQLDQPTPTGDGIKEGTGVSVKANIDSNAEIIDVPVDYANVGVEMYNFSASVTVYDSKGNEIDLNVVFRKLEDQPNQIDPATGQPIAGTGFKNNWQWMVLAPGEVLEGGIPLTTPAIGGGFLEFTDDGRLIRDVPGFIQTPPVDPAAPPGTPPPRPTMIRRPIVPGQPTQVNFGFKDIGETPQTIGFNFGEGSNPNDPLDTRAGTNGITQFASDFKIISSLADGTKSGKLEGIHIRQDGTIEGSFDSGRVKGVGRIALTDFKSSEKLEKKGENLYVSNYESGPAIVNDPGIGGMGTVNSRSLEQSNVKLSNEFVDMIEGQRAFQANAKTVTTSDEILGDMIQMKR